MSELRDLAAALRAISDSLTSIEAHVANQDANCVQLREGMHDLRNVIQKSMLESTGREKALAQVQSWMGDFSKKLSETHDAVSTLQVTMSDHRREIGQRIRDLEPEEEVTRA